MPLLLTVMASFATILGTLPIFLKFKNKDKIINYALNFASSIMLTISLFDLIPESIHYLNNIFLVLIFIILGFMFVLFIDTIVSVKNNNTLYKVGVISLFSLIMHNIPEGIITFIVSGYDLKIGITLAISIALHNIPEGISISIPIYYSTNSKIKAFLYTFISAITEPMAAIIIALTLKNNVNHLFIGYMLSATAGIMIYVAIFDILKETKFNKKIFIFSSIIMLLILFLL